MNRNTLILFKTLMTSSSGINVLKYSKDKRKRKNVIGNYFGFGVLYAALMTYCILISIEYGKIGMAQTIPATFFMIVMGVGFLFTLLKSNGYLFGFKEYDVLVSMPVSVKSIVTSRFLYMYIKTIGFILCASIAMMIGYGIYMKPAPFVYLFWIIMTFLAPMIPMALASLLGALFARIGSGFRSKNIVQTIFIFALLLLCFGIQFFANTVENTEQINETLITVSDKILQAENAFVPMRWFDRAICEGSVSDFFLFSGLSLIVFVLFYNILQGSYIKINSRLASFKKSNSRSLEFRQKSIENTIAFKEWKRMLGSSMYLTNACFGHVLMLIASIVVLFVDADKVIGVVLKGAPIKSEMLLPAIPFLVFFFIGMVSTCCCTPSLEGKNYWIMQSLPVTKMQFARGKMLFNLYLNIPVGIFGVVCFGICFHADAIYMLLYILCILACIAYSTTCGMMCGLKFMKLDWDSDIEIVKQGTATVAYLLPNMFVSMGLIAGVVFLSFVLDGRIVLLILTMIYAALALFFYNIVRKICKE